MVVLGGGAFSCERGSPVLLLWRRFMTIGACAETAYVHKHGPTVGFYGVVVLMIEEPLCKGTSLTKKRTSLGSYRRPMPRVLGGSYECVRFPMGEVPL